MEYIHYLIDFVLHIDVHLAALVAQYGIWVYAILFVIVFCETGLVVTPFLPGDSLLFVAGALAALPTNGLNVHLLALAMAFAAVLGDASNYEIGRLFGTKLFRNPNSKIFKQSYLEKTHAFYDKYGGKTIVALFIYAGYLFGELDIVQRNLKLLIVAIIVLSVLPAVIEVWRARRGRRKTK